MRQSLTIFPEDLDAIEVAHLDDARLSALFQLYGDALTLVQRFEGGDPQSPSLREARRRALGVLDEIAMLTTGHLAV